MLDFMSKSLEYMWWSMFTCHAYLFALFCCCLGWCNVLGDAMIWCMLGSMLCHARWMLGWFDMYARWMLGDAMIDVC